MLDDRPRVVIVGGGFGGLNAARTLRRAPARVILLDRRNHHLFQPLLYQVATAALSPAEIASPIRSVLRRQPNAEVIMGEVAAVHLNAHEVELTSGQRIGYDHLIIAAGAVDAYFGHDWGALAPGLKSLEDAVEIRRRFLLAFEAAERADSPAERRALLTTVVIGAGPTGVELAGAMAEMARHSLTRDFRRIDPSTARIILVEGGERVLPGYAPELSAKAEEALRDRGVEVRTGSLVGRIEEEAVFVGEERIATRNIVWAAGVAASPLGKSLDVELDSLGRVPVNADLTLPGYPEVYVVGDLARVSAPDGEPFPGLAPVAIQQGQCAARNIRRTLAGEKTRAFRYVDKGVMATVGRGAAIAEIGRIKLHGLIAWFAWLFVHLFFLIGFRNRVAVILEWAWAYLSWQRGSRLITGRVGSSLVPEEEVASDPR